MGIDLDVNTKGADHEDSTESITCQYNMMYLSNEVPYPNASDAGIPSTGNVRMFRSDAC